ncbi:Uma2 family endonuclease [Asanoa sp. NPDC050611]|uniref:Uma2 family endonuclease n=1 Tax=Asanoa sp. NPDC050611 TaxID=3157098 RepID=UPI0033F4D586
MTVATHDGVGLGPWSEDDYFELGETPNRIELIDGSLLVSPAPTVRHQHLSFLLTQALSGAARREGLAVYQAVNVRLKTDRIVIPDLVVSEVAITESVVEATDVKMICEIVSPSNAVADRVTKMRLYAVAGIPWYLLVEKDESGFVLQLLHLQGDHYAAVAKASGDDVLHLDEPLVADLEVGELNNAAG